MHPRAAWLVFFPALLAVACGGSHSTSSVRGASADTTVNDAGQPVLDVTVPTGTGNNFVTDPAFATFISGIEGSYTPVVVAFVGQWDSNEGANYDIGIPHPWNRESYPALASPGASPSPPPSPPPPYIFSAMAKVSVSSFW
jgi:hypothetical protein